VGFAKTKGRAGWAALRYGKGYVGHPAAWFHYSRKPMGRGTSPTQNFIFVQLNRTSFCG
jgi:hypothetical protein